MTPEALQRHRGRPKGNVEGYPLATTKHTPPRVHLTPERVRRAACPKGKQQRIIWDDSPRSLGLRVTHTGAKSYIFEFRIHGRNGRVTIGSDAMPIDEARAKARECQTLVDNGIDPRDQKAELAAQRARERAEAKRKELTVGALWPEYIAANESRWSDNHKHDHRKAMQAPGEPRKRSKKQTVAGPLYALADIRLADLTPERLKRWAETESKTRPTSTARAFRLLRAFLNWANETPEHSGLADPVALLARKVRRAIQPSKAKTDSLQREMLAGWFAAVRQHPNPVVSAYLEALLLTGARREEMASLKWEGVDFRWLTMTIADKVEGERVIPLPPYLAQRLYALPRRNEWVFSSATSESGRLTDIYRAHQRALTAAGLPHITFHGLRRSFATLSEWVECPVGIVAQIQGHKPSAIAEKHYRQRPIDLLRVWHTKIEGWILAEAGIKQPKEGKGLKGVRAV